MQVLEFFFLTGILVIFRSRRFPPFYTIGLNEINNPCANAENNNADANARRMMLAPLLETVITHKIFEDDLTAATSRGSAQA